MEEKIIFVKTIFQNPNLGYIGKVFSETKRFITLKDVMEIEMIVDDSEDAPLLTFRIIPFSPRSLIASHIKINKDHILVKEPNYHKLYEDLIANVSGPSEEPPLIN